MSDQSNNVSDADVRARLTDPRNDPNKLQFDRGFAAETDRLSQQVWGAGAAASSSAPPYLNPGAGARPTSADLEARIRDPRYDSRSPQFDRAFADETDRLWQQAYDGNGPESSTRPNQPARGPADQVPADIKGYTLANSDKLAPHVQRLEGDELYNAARKLARDAGLSQKQFSAVFTPLIETLAEKGGQHTGNLEAEWKKLIPAEARDRDERAQRVAAGRRIEAALDFVERDAVAAGLDRKIAGYVVEQLGESELGIRAIEWISSLAGGWSRMHGRRTQW